MLEKFYNKFESSLKKTKRFSSDKISLFFIQNINQRGYKKIFNQIFNDSDALIYYNTSEREDRREIKRLAEGGYVLKSKSLDSPNSYHITFKGIVEFEKINNPDIFSSIINQMDLIMFDNIEFKLDDREKIICYFLLVLGRIDSDHKFNFAKGKDYEKRISKRVLDDFKDISYTLLDLGVIENELDWELSNNSKARTFIQKVTDLPKTEIYKNQRGGPWYLDLSNEKRKQVFLELLLSNFDKKNKHLLEDKIARDVSLLCLVYNFEKPDLSNLLNGI